METNTILLICFALGLPLFILILIYVIIPKFSSTDNKNHTFNNPL